jgi:putative polyhydroxyalkanoate system protein
MADIELTRAHSMGLDGGREAVEQVAQQLETDLGVQYQWEDDALLFEGQGAEGRIDVAADAVTILIDLGAFLQPMQGRLEEEAGRYLDEYLEDE